MIKSVTANERDIELTLRLREEAAADSGNDADASHPTRKPINALRHHGRSSRRKSALVLVISALCIVSIFYRFSDVLPTPFGRPDWTRYTTATSLYYNHLPSQVAASECPTGMACFRKAAYLSPKDLMSGAGRSSTGYNGSVPRILHQSWGEEALPERVSRWSTQCRMLHPEWQWVLWTDADNRRLVVERYPWFLSTYDSLDSSIKRADAVRNLYMHAFGGVYLDYDLECIRPFDSLFSIKKAQGSEMVRKEKQPKSSQHALQAFFGWMGDDHSHPHSLPNDWMASSPGHPFFLMPLSVIVQTPKVRQVKPEELTGPVVLRDQLLLYKQEYEGKREVFDAVLPSLLQVYHSSRPLSSTVARQEQREAFITILDEHVIHPFSWITGSHARPGKLCLAYLSTFDPEACKEALHVQENGAHAVAYWTHSWESTEALDY